MTIPDCLLKYRNKLYLLLFICILSLPLPAAAATTIVRDGLYYQLIQDPVDGYAGTAQVIEAPDDAKSEILSAMIPDYVTDDSGNKYIVTCIKNGAFYKCTSLKQVSIPESVVLIEDNAFLYCNSIESLRIEPAQTPLNFGLYLFDGQNSNKHKDYAEMNCYIGRELTSGGRSSFLMQTNTVKCEIEGVENITSYYIKDCDSLRELILHNGVKTVENISGCASLTHLEIPEGVTQLGNYDTSDTGLNKLNNLTYVSLPSTLLNIASFRYSDLLQTINIAAPIPPALIQSDLTLNNTPYSLAPTIIIEGTVHVLPEAEEAYRTSDIWGKDDRYTIIGDLHTAISDDNELLLSVNGGGTLSVLNSDESDIKTEYQDENTQRVQIPVSLTAIEVVVTPQVEVDIKSVKILNKAGEPIYADMRTYGRKLILTLNPAQISAVNVDFESQQLSILHLLSPESSSESSGHTILKIPHNDMYRMYYSCTPGYQIESVIFDNQVLPFEQTDTSSELPLYFIDIPSFEGEKYIRVAEVANGPITFDKSTFNDSASERLIYENGQYKITGLNQSQQIRIFSPDGQLVYATVAEDTYILPATLRGIYVICTSSHSFKIYL